MTEYRVRREPINRPPHVAFTRPPKGPSTMTEYERLHESAYQALDRAAKSENPDLNDPMSAMDLDAIHSAATTIAVAAEVGSLPDHLAEELARKLVASLPPAMAVKFIGTLNGNLKVI